MADVYSINTGFFRLDGGAMFGIVPRVLWQDKHVPDEKNRIRQAMRTLLIIDGQRIILIDTGMGNWHDQKFIDRYGLENPDFDFNQEFAAYNLSVDDITDVIVTHLHFDHAGGLAVQRENQIQPAFPNATIWVQKQQWQWAQNPSAKDRGSYLATYLDTMRDYSGLHLLDGPADITSNVTVLPFYGHSKAMQTVVIKKDGNTIWFPSDLIPMADHLRIPYIMAYDNQPVVTAEEKEMMLQKVHAEDWLIYFYHDPIYENSSQIEITVM
jgi:glyoxylase-like metal-dependent hydrolase (beta-lactamase superfamily II)